MQTLPSIVEQQVVIKAIFWWPHWWQSWPHDNSQFQYFIHRWQTLKVSATVKTFKWDSPWLFNVIPFDWFTSSGDSLLHFTAKQHIIRQVPFLPTIEVPGTMWTGYQEGWVSKWKAVCHLLKIQLDTGGRQVQCKSVDIIILPNNGSFLWNVMVRQNLVKKYLFQRLTHQAPKYITGLCSPFS